MSDRRRLKSRIPDDESRWDQWAGLLRRALGRVPPTLMESEQVYAESDSMSLSRQWIESIKAAVEAERTRISYETWPVSSGELPDCEVDLASRSSMVRASVRLGDFEPVQWDVFLDGSAWHFEALAMALDPGLAIDELESYRSHHWLEN